MSSSKGTKAERLYSVLNELDTLTVETRQISDRADKISRRLIEVQFEVAHFLDKEEGNK